MGTMLKLEIFKLKRRKFILPMILILVVGIMWFQFIFSQEVKVLANKYQFYMVIRTMLLINCMIMPLLLSVLCSRLIDIEYKGKTFQLLMTSNQSIEKLFRAKLYLAGIFVITFVVFQSLWIVVIAKLNNININYHILLLFLISFIIVSSLLVLIHMTLSLLFEKQSISIVLALIGAFIALTTSGMLPAYIQIFIPWQYFLLLSPINMVVHNGTPSYVMNNQYLLVTLAILILTILMFFIVKYVIRRREFV